MSVTAYAPVQGADEKLATAIADAMTEYHPDTYTTRDVLDTALARGLISLAAEYKVRYDRQTVQRGIGGQ